MAITSIRLQSDLESQLENLAQNFHRSKNWLINQAIREYVEKNQQETKRWEETLAALDSIKNGLSVPDEDVDSWLKSWGTDTEISPPKL